MLWLTGLDQLQRHCCSHICVFQDDEIADTFNVYLADGDVKSFTYNRQTTVAVSKVHVTTATFAFLFILCSVSKYSTACTVVQAVVKANCQSKSNKNGQISTPVAPKPLNGFLWNLEYITNYILTNHWLAYDNLLRCVTFANKILTFAVLKQRLLQQIKRNWSWVG